MCGFAGVIGAPSPTAGRSWVHAATARLVRRGPDDEGFWFDDDAGLHLGFRRLSILDLSDHGHQPMVSPDGRSVLVFNGELYGHAALRRQLEQRGRTFRGTSDTEVVLAALDEWGEGALDRFDGMFAFAWWHRRDRRLVLARDHAGIKPLFFGTDPGGRGLSFSSQYDVVADGPWGIAPVDPASLALYLELHHVPAPHGLLRHTGQVEPGELLVVEDGRLRSRRRWWDLPEPTGTLTGDDAVDQVEDALTRSVHEQLVADRPVGTFLSGGVDSALVTSLAAADAAPEPIRSFTISFPGARNDEADGARSFATAIGVDHHVIELTDDDAEMAVDAAIAASHEPVGDFSIIPTTMLTGFAADHVTVALSGDGGDELFHGYVRPWSLLRDGNWFRAPHLVRRGRYLAGRALPGLSTPSEAIAARSPGDYYRGVNSRSRALLGKLGPDLPPPPELWWFTTPPRLDHAGLVALTRRAEYHGQLQRVLRKVDLASMHHSLEVRVPLLGREVVELSSRVDVDFCLRAGERKGPLRDLLRRRVPTVAQQSVKQGFTPPLDAWIDGPLRRRVQDHLAESSWLLDDLLDRRTLRRLGDPGTPSRHWNLWTVLSLEWWLRELRSRPPSTTEVSTR